MSTTTIRLLTMCAASSLFIMTTPAVAADDARVSAEIISLARAQWAAEVAGQPAAQQMSSVADDYTEFNPDYPTRIDGKAMAQKMQETPAGGKSVFGDMLNPKVQTYGNTAILTYNFAGINRGPDGKNTASAAKSTRVYIRDGNEWKLVHANFAPVVPPGQ